MSRVVAILVVCLADLAGCGGEAPAPPATAPVPPGARTSAPPPPTVVDEVLANIRSQPVGAHRLDDYALPDAFLRRMADRIIRDSFQSSFYQVYDDGEGGGFPAPMPPPRDAARGETMIPVVAAERSAHVVALRREQEEGRPPRRGYRPDETWIASGVAADIVARRLARDGLLPTLAQVLEHADGTEGREAAALVAWLREAGLPVDLLGHFVLEGAGAGEGPSAGPGAGPLAPPDPPDLVDALLERIRRGETAASLADELARARFRFAPTLAGFEVATESGEHAIGLVRVQLTRGDYWLTPGEGGSLDVLRQLLARLPDAKFLASVETRFVEDLVPLAGAWPLGEAGRLRLIEEPLAVAQWAQDNGKAGVAPDGRWATIVPRYASRRDDGSLYVPGESSLAEGLAAAGQVIVRSPLLFQGGNLIAVRDPRTGERLLLIGEADVWRNTALGLTREQVESAFRAEFAVDRCVVLPSVSFHLDYDVSVRAIGDDLAVFVNDPVAAAREIIACALPALRASNAISPEDADAADAHHAAGRDAALAQVLGNAIGPHRAADRGFPSSLAIVLSTNAADSPVGNLQCLVLAIDVLMTTDATDARLPPPGPSRDYVEALRRIDQRRRALHDTLREHGWKVLAVPSLPAASRGITYVNGVHDRSRYLMPAYGGLYAPLDRKAAEAFAAHLGPDVEVIPILCAETQRRSGAVHCAISVYPAR